jgi:hypothetical protein
MKKLIRRLKAIWNIQENLKQYYAHLNFLEQKINERTTIHADIHMKYPHQIIMVGRYRKRDYVRVFDVEESHFHSLVEMLRQNEKGSKRGRFDMPHGLNISAVYDKDTF